MQKFHLPGQQIFSRQSCVSWEQQGYKTCEVRESARDLQYNREKKNNFRSSTFLDWRLHANLSGGPSPEPADDGRTFVRHRIRAGFGCVGSETGMAKISSNENWEASVHEAPLLSILGRCGNNNQGRGLVYYARVSLLWETAGGHGFIKISHQTVPKQQCLIWILTTLSLSVSNDRFSLPIDVQLF